jgi:hypothetical protein
LLQEMQLGLVMEMALALVLQQLLHQQFQY